jgi:hypothetical protein
MTRTQIFASVLGLSSLFFLLDRLLLPRRIRIASERKAQALRELNGLGLELIGWSVPEGDYAPKSGNIRGLCKSKTGQYFFYNAGLSGRPGRSSEAAESDIKKFTDTCLKSSD